VLHIAPLSPDGTRVIGEDRLVFDGRADHPTIEGPKLYRHDGWYWIFAPAGGVTTGWQTVMRSRDILGPYEDRVVLAQGDTRINGPHQGAWIRLDNGDDWFIHFQDRGAYGRITHLQPMKWVGGWPVIGEDDDGDGTGEPVLEHAMPSVRAPASSAVPQTTDEFDGASLGLQWQWQANPADTWYSLIARRGWMRLNARPLAAGAKSLWPVPSLLLQKLPAAEFTASTTLAADGLAQGETAGLLVMGLDYAYIAVRRTATGYDLVQARAKDVDRGGAEQEIVAELSARTVHLRVRVSEGGVCRFEWSRDGRTFTPFGEPFTAREGKWIGAKVGLFAVAPAGATRSGHADFDFLRIGAGAR
jgi:beta-xylosidase